LISGSPQGRASLSSDSARAQAVAIDGFSATRRTDGLSPASCHHACWGAAAKLARARFCTRSLCSLPSTCPWSAHLLQSLHLHSRDQPPS